VESYQRLLGWQPEVMGGKDRLFAKQLRESHICIDIAHRQTKSMSTPLLI